MSKKLSIIVTYHNEGSEITVPLFNSINNQLGIDFNDVEIIISNNCEAPKDISNLYLWNNLAGKIKNVYPPIKNKLGCSREYAVRQSSGDWIIFADCDDELFSQHSLFNIFNTVRDGVDIYHCKEVHENWDDNGNYSPVVDNRNYVFLHGKIFSSKLLKSRKFNKDELSDHEDIYTCLLFNGIGVTEELADISIYIWKENPLSVTRINNREHDYLCAPDLIRCYQYIYEDVLKERGNLDRCKRDIIDFIRYRYRQIKCRSFTSDVTELEGLLALFIDSFDKELLCLDEEPLLFGNEQYNDFIHRIVETFNAHSHKYWTHEYLYEKYTSDWSIDKKSYREYVRVASDYYLNNKTDEALTYAKKAYSLYDKSYKPSLLLGLTYGKIGDINRFKLYIKDSINLYYNNLNNDYDDMNVLTNGIEFDAAALLNYYNKDYDLSFECGKIAVEMAPYDSRIVGNMEYYKNKGVTSPQKRSWVSLLSDNSYMCGQVALVKSLLDVHTSYMISCLVTDNVSEENVEALNKMGVNVIPVKRYIPLGYTQYSEEYWNNATSLSVQGWHNALSKLEIFNLTQFDKIVYIDNDTVVLKNIDELFDKPHMSAVPDFYGTTRRFCSGLLVLEPNNALYNDLIAFSDSFTDSDSFSGGEITIKHKGMIHDQLILQQFYKDWDYRTELHLPIWYHTWVTYFDENGSNKYMESNVLAYHYIDAKPWKVGIQYFKDRVNNGFPQYGERLLEYVDYMNNCINILKKNGITSSSLIIPD